MIPQDFVPVDQFVASHFKRNGNGKYNFIAYTPNMFVTSLVLLSVTVLQQL
jgi:hypothetical protein